MVRNVLRYLSYRNSANGIANNASSFLEGDVIPHLMQASGGIIGIACRIIGEVVRQMALRGSRDLTEGDFSGATARLRSLSSDDGNPFCDGLRGMKISK